MYGIVFSEMAASESVSDDTYTNFHVLLASFAKDDKITEKGIGKMSKQCCSDLSHGMDIAFSGVSKGKK